MKVIQRFRKRLAIRSYIRKLPRLLAKDYGRSKYYTPRQVRSTIERAGLNTYYSCYGIAIFSSREAFSTFHAEVGEHCEFDAMRSEIAHLYSSGNTDFVHAEIDNTLFEHVKSLGHDGSNHGGFGDSHASD